MVSAVTAERVYNPPQIDRNDARICNIYVYMKKEGGGGEWVEGLLYIRACGQTEKRGMRRPQHASTGIKTWRIKKKRRKTQSSRISDAKWRCIFFGWMTRHFLTSISTAGAMCWMDNGAGSEKQICAFIYRWESILDLDEFWPYRLRKPRLSKL